MPTAHVRLKPIQWFQEIGYCPQQGGEGRWIESLLRCPDCNREMRLFGVELAADGARELYTFECDNCGRLEVRGVRIG